MQTIEQATITHVVQARCFGLGWVDHYAAPSLAEAQEAERLLLANNKAWMSETAERKTRIVGVADSRCAAMYPQVRLPRE